MRKGLAQTQKTIHGHEIPMPERRDFLRNLEKIAKPKSQKSRARPARRSRHPKQ